MVPFVGQVIRFAGVHPPRGWAQCDGRELEIARFGMLYSVLGTMHGGDGKNTFALPDLNGDDGVMHIIATDGTYPEPS